MNIVCEPHPTRTFTRTFAAEMARAKGVELIFEFELFKLSALLREAATLQTREAIEHALDFERLLIQQIERVQARGAQAHPELALA